MPYWHRGKGRIERESLVDYDTPGLNDWYEIPRRTGLETFMEPYEYKVAGKPILITSLMVPLKVKGRFLGLLGADYTLQQLQDDLMDKRPLGVGQYLLLSNAGCYVAHPDPLRIGATADDLPLEACAAIRSGKPYQFTDRHGVDYLFRPLLVGASKTPWSLCLRFDVARILGEG